MFKSSSSYLGQRQKDDFVNLKIAVLKTECAAKDVKGFADLQSGEKLEICVGRCRAFAHVEALLLLQSRSSSAITIEDTCEPI